MNKQLLTKKLLQLRADYKKANTEQEKRDIVLKGNIVKSQLKALEMSKNAPKNVPEDNLPQLIR